MRDELSREEKIEIMYNGLYVLGAGGGRAFGVWFERYCPEEGKYSPGERDFLKAFYRQMNSMLENGFVLFDIERHPEKVEGLLREVERK